MINIQIYRAKKKDSNEYVIGYYQTETGTNVEDKNNMFSTLRHVIVDLDKHQLRLDLFGDGKLHDFKKLRREKNNLQNRLNIANKTVALQLDELKRYDRAIDLGNKKIVSLIKELEIENKIKNRLKLRLLSNKDLKDKIYDNYMKDLKYKNDVIANNKIFIAVLSIAMLIESIIIILK